MTIAGWNSCLEVVSVRVERLMGGLEARTTVVRVACSVSLCEDVLEGDLISTY